jgi:xylose isomerase
MAGLNFVHGVAQALEAGKLFHIDLNDQSFGRYDQDFRFGAVNLKSAFFLVKLLEDNHYDGSRHFDAHAYRTEDYEGVKDFARGCMRTYLILKEKTARWNADKEIQALVAEIHADDGSMNQYFGKYSAKKASALREHAFDRQSLGARGLKYERLDQLTVDLLLGAR